MRKSYLFISVFIFCCSTMWASTIYGFWQTVDKKTHLPTSVIAVYPYQGKIYGKIIASCNKKGAIEETIYAPKSRAKGVSGKPYYCGLDIIALSPQKGGEPAQGHVVDPRNGNVYDAKVWVEKGKLVLRGELLMFGRNELLYPFNDQNFKKPDLYSLVPSNAP